MIITIKGADFSSANIGTLNTYVVSKSIGRGATYEIPGFVDKNSSVNWVITLDEDYTFGTYSVTMGGETIIPTVDGNTMTIAIANVTGNIRISVATVNINTGEEEGGEGNDDLTLDSMAYESLTYRDIFVTNNIAVNVNNGDKTTSVNGNYSYGDSTGTTTIVEKEESAPNYIPIYYLSVSGSSSQQTRLYKKDQITDTGAIKLPKTTKLYCGANINVTRYLKGYCGIILGSAMQAAINRQTDGWERLASIIPANSNTSDSGLFIGSASSANLDGGINNPVIVNSTIFSTQPSQTEWETLYDNYNTILLNS